MPSRMTTFELDAADADARWAANRALAELGWPTHDDAGQIVAREDAAGLRCRMAPVNVRISTDQVSGDRTSIAMEVSVPGFGPDPKRQLVDRSAGLSRGLGAGRRDHALSEGTSRDGHSAQRGNSSSPGSGR